MTRRHLVKLTPDDEQPAEPTTWRVEGGWLVLITDDSDEQTTTVLLPPSWPAPVTVITTHEDDG